MDAVATPARPITPGSKASPAATRLGPHAGWLGVAAITAAAAVLRLAALGKVPEDPYYDAAVRSMGLSLHNFFFGVFEPSGSLAIDKPPIDLWLQVISVKLFGFNSVALKLPQALAGTAAVPLLYDALRRVFGVAAGLAGALALAVLPIAVLTARSDTMDAVMMALIVLAFWCVVCAGETGRVRWLYWGAAALGVAFNVKLFEVLVAVPALVVLAWMVMTGPPRRRALHVGGATAVFVVVALSWLSVTLLFPSSQRPYAIGSTNGSAWDAAFVFNGYDRIAGKTTQFAGAAPHPATGARARRLSSDAVRAQYPLGKPSVTRLLDHSGPLSGLRLGYLVLAAVLLGAPALLAATRGAWSDTPSPAAATTLRMQRGTAVALGLWLLTGIVLFSEMARLHPRYTDGFTPAVAAVAGVGVVWATRRGRWRTAALAVSLGALIGYCESLLAGETGVWWLTTAAGVGAVAIASSLITWPRLAPVGLTLALVAMLALPATTAISIVGDHASDAGNVGLIRPARLALLSAYLRAHRGAARYEVATAGTVDAGSLIVHDALPVLVLTNFDGSPLVTVARLHELAASGQVRYALINGRCRARTPRSSSACAPAVRWVRANGVDVSRAARLGQGGVLWRLPTR